MFATFNNYNKGYNEFVQLVYFPYLSMKDIDSFTFGDIRIWNFERKGKEIVTDPELYKKISALLGVNYEYNRQIKDIGVVAVGELDFRELTSTEMDNIGKAKYTLFIAALAKMNMIPTCADNAGLYICTSENFELVVQNFQLSQDGIATSTGYIVNISSYIGKTSEKIQISAPRHLNRFSRLRLNGEILTKLNLCKTNDEILYNRTLRAVEQFMESYYNSDNVSKKARILLQASAFETLFDMEDSTDKQTDFLHNVKLHTRAVNSKTREKLNSWAMKYYDLRSRITHGTKTGADTFSYHSQRHFDIATIVFILCMDSILSNDANEEQYPARISWEKCDKCERDVSHSHFVYIDNSLNRAIRNNLGNSN